MSRKKTRYREARRESIEDEEWRLEEGKPSKEKKWVFRERERERERMKVVEPWITWVLRKDKGKRGDWDWGVSNDLKGRGVN